MTTAPALHPKPPRRSRASRGVAALELALIMPVLLLMSLGVAEFGRLVYTYGALVKAVHGAARYVAMADRLAAADRETARQEGAYMVLYGDVRQHDQSIVPGLTPDKVFVCSTDNCNDAQHNVAGVGIYCFVSVRITGFRYQPMLSVVLPASVPFSTITSFMRGRPTC